MRLTGHNFIGGRRSQEGSSAFHAVNPALNSNLDPPFYDATQQEIHEAATKAGEAWPAYGRMNGSTRAEFLEAIADEIMKLGDDLLKRCNEETALPEARLVGERARTVHQLRLFAGILREGSWIDARIDTADPGRQPVPKPDIRSMQAAIGPVAVFGASNFPFAFSVAGGDTASALAAGCPVVFKAHPAHPGTCELVAFAILKAVEKTHMPDGVFSMIHGASNDVGQMLITHPAIKAVGFTGSFRGGKALFDAAVRRPEPIPVYAEMGSINPVFILPRALKNEFEKIAQGLTASVTLGVGQFCTNPGLVVYRRSDDAPKFQEALSAQFEKLNGGTMLTSAIRDAYAAGVKRLSAQEGVEILAHPGETGRTQESDQLAGGLPYVLITTSNRFLSNPVLEEEVFGPSTLIVTADDGEDMLSVAEKLGGHLTASIFGTGKDLEEHTQLIDMLRRKVGRLIYNGFPTGVEVCHAMVHGGPFPATTDSRATSVGTRAVYRFTRPVSYQNFPDALLPDELKEDNPLGIWRLVDGEMKR